jgi:hypothetical protein
MPSGPVGHGISSCSTRCPLNTPTQGFVPGVVLHEFETWVIAAALERELLLDERSPVEKLRAVAAQFGGDVELIDSGPKTAPSKQVAAAWPGYSKTVDGIDALLEAGLSRVLEHCPVLRDWLYRLASSRP